MSSVERRGRSYEPITTDDLKRLAEIAKADREDFFRRHPKWRRLYSGRLLGSALCQGAALHYVRGKVGINDFDVYTFFAAHPDANWPYRRIVHRDFGDSKFGRSIEKPTPIGRRVDLIGRSLAADPSEDIVVVLRRYLHARQTATSRFLAEKAAVLLEPNRLLGMVVWPAD